MNHFVESTVRTTKLWCSKCRAKIHREDDVIFELNDRGKMENVYGERCGCRKDFEMEAYEETVHQFSSEGLGQD
jgi:hypothetical protein